MIHLRPEVLWFAQQMELKLRENDDEKGRRGWTVLSNRELMHGVDREVEELREAYINARSMRPGAFTAPDLISEAADVANFAMMIADVARTRFAVEKPERGPTAYGSLGGR